MQPYKAIFPILAVPNERTAHFLGTGFFIEQDGTFLTAKHVFADYGLDRSEDFRIAMLSKEGEVKRYAVTDVKVSERLDIARARATGVEDLQPLQLATEDASTNLDVLTEEYSGTMPKRLADGGTGLNIVSYTRKGNVLCQREHDYPGPEPAMTLELSFPALGGSSGAPVLVERTGAVIGMVVANVGRELLPAQIERTEYEGGVKEEVKYFLPTGMAIHWSHLREFVEE